VVVTSNGRFFVTAEAELHLIWNMPSRVVLFKEAQPNIIQLLLMVKPFFTHLIEVNVFLFHLDAG